MDSESLIYWGFEFNPFERSDRSEQFFLSQSHREALDVLRRAIADGCRAIYLHGPSGVGKSFLLNTLCRWLESKKHMVVVAVGRPGESLLDELLIALNFERGALPQHELFPALKACLAREQRRRGLQTVLLVDLPNLLGDAEARAQVGALAGLHRASGPLLSIVLAGCDGFDSPRWRMANGFRDHIQCHHELGPLQAHETPRYIEHRLRTAGCWEKLFDEPSCEAIHQISAGLPSRINVLCVQLLEAARTRRLRTVNLSLTESLASMMHRLHVHTESATDACHAGGAPPSQRSGWGVTLPLQVSRQHCIPPASVSPALPRAERLCTRAALALQLALERRVLRKAAPPPLPSDHEIPRTSEPAHVPAHTGREEHSNVILEHFLATQRPR